MKEKVLIQDQAYDIRYTLPADEKFLLEWMLDPETNRFFPVQTENEIKDSVRNWMGYARYKASLTATWKKEPCGIGTLFLMPYQKVSHHCMFYLIVKKEARRQGIGGSMVKNLIHLASHHFKLESVHAEVFEGCPLFSVLKRQGFESFAYQERYVKQSNGKYLARHLLESFI
ncbi:MAG: GNAT family protein [Chlamydiota bacterium]